MSYDGVRLSALALLFAVVPAVAVGCAFDSKIAVRFEQASPALVTESFKPTQTPRRIQGRTTRRGQKVRIDCSVTVAYDVTEATGTAVLVQRFVAHLHTRRLPRGTAYELDCTGPVIVEIPSGASGVRATSTSASGQEAELPVQAPVASIPIAFGKRLREERGMQLALVRWPDALPAGDYGVELAFSLAEARTIRQKVVYAASVRCGTSRYLQPILPPVTRMARVPAFTIGPSAGAESFSIPRVAGGISSYAERTRTLSCRAAGLIRASAPGQRMTSHRRRDNPGLADWETRPAPFRPPMLRTRARQSRRRSPRRRCARGP